MIHFQSISFFRFWKHLGCGLLACWGLVGCNPEPAFHPAGDSSLPLQSLEHFSRADSIIKEMGSISNTQKKLDSLLHLADHIKDYDVDAAFDYANEAYKIATLKNLDLYKGISLYYMALLKKRKRKFGEGIADALADAQMSQKIFSRLDEKLWLARANNLIGIIYYRPVDLDSARWYLDEALKIIRENPIWETDSLELTGEIFHDLGNTYLTSTPDTALFYFQKSLDYYTQTRRTSAMARAWNNIAMVYRDRGEFAQAEAYVQKSLEYANASKDLEVLGSAQLIMGDIRLRQYKQTKEDSLFFQALDSLKQPLTYQKENRYKAYQYLGYAWDLYSFSYPDSIQFIDSALVYYREAMVHARREGALRAVQDMLKNITTNLCAFTPNCEIILGQPLYSFLNDTYQQILDTTTVTLNEANQRLLTFERDYIEAQSKRKRLNQLYLSGGVLILSGLIFLLVLQFYKQKRLQARLETLRAQINPHFISNSLNAIENLVNQDQNQAASKYIIHFSRLSRRLLNSSRNASTSLEEELKTLEHFLALEQLRFRDKLAYKIEVSPDIDPQLLEVPGLILQPYVENAIWHGIKPKSGAGLLQVRVERRSKYLICIIEDDGIGHERAQKLKAGSILQNHKSHGMKITEERLDLVGKVRGSKVKIIDLKDPAGQATGTRVIVQLPFKLIHTENPNIWQKISKFSRP